MTLREFEECLEILIENGIDISLPLNQIMKKYK